MKTMAYQNKLLLRSYLGDDGTNSSHGSYCASPDIISHTLVADARAAFGTADAYAQNLNQALDWSSRTNPVYVRAKSLQGGDIRGYLRLYRASASLFMNTDQWKNNKLLTPNGDETVTFSTTALGGISVGSDIFQLDGTQDNYCIVGIINETASAETLPENFSNYDDFISWVHEHPAVAVRNFFVNNSGNVNNYEILLKVENPEGVPVSQMIQVEAENLPINSVFGISSSAVPELNKTETFTASGGNRQIMAAAASLPANFSGYVKIFAKAPNGSAWGDNARVMPSQWVTSTPEQNMYQYGATLKGFALDSKALAFMERVAQEKNAPLKLVRVGDCDIHLK
jgi:hypothetical protein